MPATYEPIASVTLGSATNSLSFTNIPGTYTDLVLTINNVDTVEGSGKRIRFNGDSAGNYSRTFVYGTGSSVASGRDSNQANVEMPTSTTRYTERVQIMSYANTNVFKTILYEFAMPSYLIGRMVSLWRSTSAITSLEVSSGGVNFAAGSTWSLYGIKAA